MSGTVQSLGRKIQSAGELGNVVRAMKALAASTIEQYEQAVRAVEAYARTVELGLGACLRQSPGSLAPAGTRAPRRFLVALVIGSDQGLAGRFNEILVDHAVEALRALGAGRRQVWGVGARANALLGEAGLSPTASFAVPASVSRITTLVGEILVQLERCGEAQGTLEVQVFHNRPGPSATYQPVGQRLLPFDAVWEQQARAAPWPSSLLPEVIGDPGETLQAFIQGHLFVGLFQAFAESLASENASCLASMQRAEKNIGEMLEDLGRDFRRTRQEGIDEELFDVIAGYEALSRRPPGAPA
jgi:F-type H+-transporting ATPase subunit gamma